MVVLGLYIYGFKEQRIVNGIVKLDKYRAEIEIPEEEVIKNTIKWCKDYEEPNHIFNYVVIAKTIYGVYCISIDSFGRLIFNKDLAKKLDREVLLTKIAQYRNNNKLW